MSNSEIGTSEIGTTAFLGVFEQKLEKMKSRLKTELGKKRNERNKEWIRKEIHDAKKLRDLCKKMRKQQGSTCPHCGGEL